MTRTRLLPMSEETVAQWRAARETKGSALPQATGGGELELLEIHVDDVAVGGVALGHTSADQRSRVSIRLLETSLADDDAPHWLAVLDAIEQHVRVRGARTIVTAVPARLVGPFQQAGFVATMTGVGITLEPGSDRLTPVTSRVLLRPMDGAERRRFVPEAREFLRAGMARAGVLGDPDAPLDLVERRLAALADDPPAEEVLLTAVADGTPVGRVWGTSVERGDLVDLEVNTIDLVAEHRGQGLTRLVLAALETYAREHGLRDVRGRVYAHLAQARSTLTALGVGVDEVHLRKDLRRPSG